MGKIDIYNKADRLGSAVQKLGSVRERDREDILLFKDDMIANGIGVLRIIKYVIILRRISESIGKPFRECTTDDIKKFVSQINSNQELAEWTKHDYKILLKRFFKWLLGNDKEYPQQVSWIKSSGNKNGHVLPEELITREEIEMMAKVARNSRDKAFILMLFESGCRIGELMTLQLKNVSFDSIGMIIQVTGKTGSRRVRLLNYVKEITEWLDIHPDKNNPEAYLWTKNNTTEPVGYAGMGQDGKRHIGFR